MFTNRFIKLASFGFVLMLLVATIVPKNRFFEIAKGIEIYAALFKTVNEVYVDEVNPNQLLNTTVESMLAELDPYTIYISEDKIESYRTMSTGQYGGIGSSTVRIKGRVFISSVVANGPADNAGIKVGDEIISASGITVLNKSNETLNQLVRGQSKSSLALGIRKNGESKTHNFTVIRDNITIKNVPYYGMLEENVGYIKFTQFTKNGGKNIEKAVRELKKEGASNIIIDLRGNAGGLLNESVNICNLFIAKNKLVVETKGKRPENTTQFKTLNQPLDLNIPVVIMINNASASASEIVAGTLQDYDRAVILGQKSYGKGLVQNVRPLTYNSQLKVTIAKYYTPSGRCIQALDYTHRNEDGSIAKIADSLKTTYQTMGGRTVYGGGGVDPDVLMVNDKWPAIVIKLIQDGEIYLYANAFKLKNESIAPPQQFELSDSQFNEFIDWVVKKDFEFDNQLSKDMLNLESIYSSTGTILPVFSSTLERIKVDISKPIQHQLAAEITLLKKVLEAEIALRYYNQEGGIETTLADDKEIKKAIQILSNTTKYNAILSGS